MSERRPEPFAIALGELRRRLREGRYRPEHRLAAKDLATELRLSPTPVREALSRLAGEGLLEDRRGQGFFVRRLGRRDVVALYRMRLAQLALALQAAEHAASAGFPEEADAVVWTEQLFAGWVAAAGVRTLGHAFGAVQAQLAPVRQLEGQLLSDLMQEAADLAAAPDRRERLVRLRRFHQRRVRLAESLADLLERPEV